MSKTADVLQAIWTDPWFLELPTDAKCLYLWAITTDHGNQAGLFVIGRRVIEFETGMTPKRLDAALAATAGKLVYDEPTGAMWVVGKAKRVRAKTSQIAKSIKKAVIDCPLPTLAESFVNKYGKTPWLEVHLADLQFSALETGKSEPRMNLSEVPMEPPGLGQGLKEEQHGPSRAHARPGTGTGQDQADSIPADFPADLRPALEKVVPILQRIAATRGADAISTAAVARAMENFPRRPHLEAAQDLEHWLLHGTGQSNKPKDVVGYWRNQLKRQTDRATTTPGTRRTTVVADLTGSPR